MIVLYLSTGIIAVICDLQLGGRRRASVAAVPRRLSIMATTNTHTTNHTHQEPSALVSDQLKLLFDILQDGVESK